MGTVNMGDPSTPKKQRSVSSWSSTLLSCFRGSSTRSELSVVDSRRSMALSSWSRFRAKKKTVPLDQPTVLSEIMEEENTDIMKMPVKLAQSSKKGFFRRFYKDNKKCTEKKSAYCTTTNIQPPISHVLSKCKARTKPAISFHCEPGPIRTRSPKIEKNVRSADSGGRNQSGQRRKKKKGGEANVGSLIVIAMTLGTLLLGGRVPAILCISAFFYFSPYLNSATTANRDSDKKKGSVKKETTSIVQRSIRRK